MQAATLLCGSIGGHLRLFQVSTGKMVAPRRQLSRPNRRTILPPRIGAFSAPETSTVDYNASSTSVFPAEACDTIGGEACDAEMFPEAKPSTYASSAKSRVESKEVDRDYLEYTEPKTVFPGEACDDLGGEFCEPEYQQGVYKEKP